MTGYFADSAGESAQVPLHELQFKKGFYLQAKGKVYRTLSINILLQTPNNGKLCEKNPAQRWPSKW